VREGGFSSINEYCDHILSGYATDEAVDDFINAVTTNKTDFFREPGHFDYGARSCPKCRPKGGGDPVLERGRLDRHGAYTLAMVLADLSARVRIGIFHPGHRHRHQCAGRGAAGIYPVTALAPVPSLRALCRRRPRSAPRRSASFPNCGARSALPG
jgi:chemotaxis protein methyltransferase CheR